MPVLTGIDLLAIQEYVFGSNRLRDVLAASAVIDAVTNREQVLQLPEAKVILAGGGNALLEFDSLEEARRWTANFTRRLHDELAPDLEAAIVHREFPTGRLAETWLKLQADLARRKLERVPSVPLMGLSVTAACILTGRPATAVDDGGQPISRRVEAFRRMLQEFRKRWHEFLPRALPHAPGWQAEFPVDLDELGRTREETSLIGVVHVDGNGVGRLIRRWLRRNSEASDEKVRREAREWSSDLRKLGEQVLHSLVRRIAARIELKEKDGRQIPALTGQPEDLGFALHRAASGTTVYLPICPIVLGGDDLTFVCDGRIALDLTAAALETFERQPVRHLGADGAGISASAGVAIVRSHAPFYRAYAAAKALCQSAKRARNEHAGAGSAGPGGWMDWIVGLTRPLENVEEARGSYRTDGLKLTMRPYPVTGGARRETWQWLDEQVLGPGPQGSDKGFRGDPRWRASRNRVKQLENLLRLGPEEVERQILMWQASTPGLALPAGLPNGGFPGSATPLLDAIELVDLHLRLEEPAQKEEAVS